MERYQSYHTLTGTVHDSAEGAGRSKVCYHQPPTLPHWTSAHRSGEGGGDHGNPRRDWGAPTPGEVLLHNFYSHWENGEEGTVFTENDTPGLRNRQKGLPKYALLAAALDPRCVYMNGVPPADQEQVWSRLKEELLALPDFQQPPQQEPQPIQGPAAQDPDDAIMAGLAAAPAALPAAVNVAQVRRDNAASVVFLHDTWPVVHEFQQRKRARVNAVVEL